MPSEARSAFRRHIFTILRAYGGNHTGFALLNMFQHTGRHIKCTLCAALIGKGLHPSRIKSDPAAPKDGCPSGGFKPKRKYDEGDDDV